MTVQAIKARLKATLPILRRRKTTDAKPAEGDAAFVPSTNAASDTANLALAGLVLPQPQDTQPAMQSQQAAHTSFGHQFKSKLKEKLKKIGLAPKSARTDAEASPSELAAAQIVMVENQHYVFGLEWRFFTDSKDLNRTLRAAKRDGFTHKVVTQTEDLVGIGRIPTPPRKGRLHSASLQLAQGVSMGGLELFVFKLDQDLFGLVALNESRPIIGFEKLGNRSEIMALAGEFQLSQIGYTIRQLGNTGALEHEEPIKLSEAFAQPEESSTRIKAIPDYKILLLKTLAVVAVGMLVFFVYGSINEAKIKENMKRMAQERDPNFIYEKDIQGGMSSTGLPAQVQMERWRSAIKDIPLTRQGWSLTGINCLPNECTLSWKREYGSYADFFAVSQAHELRSTESQTANNPASSTIQTVLKVPTVQSSIALERENLPKLEDTHRLLASQLQDLSLLKNSTVELKKPELFPAAAGLTLEQINRPVVRGDWSISHEIWSLNDLSFPIPAMVIDSLNISPPQKSNSWTYTLKGRFYAKGKDF